MATKKPVTLDEIEALIEKSRFPADIFGSGDVHAAYKRLATTFHPDKFSDLTEKVRAARVFTSLGLWKALSEKPEFLELGDKTYLLGQPIGAGDLSVVRYAQQKGRKVVIAKIGSTVGGSKLLLKEREVLDKLRTGIKGTGDRKFFPQPLDSVLLLDKRRVNLFEYLPGLYTAEAIRTLYPEGVHPRHLVWMFKRTMSALHLAHQQGWVHGAPLPLHLLFHPEGHGVVLADWTLTVPIGKPLTAAPRIYLDWYPSECKSKQGVTAGTDIYLAAKTICYLAGGDPKYGTFPDIVPPALRTFLKGCMLESVKMRPGSAGALIEEMSDAASICFGPPKFHVLEMQRSC